MRVALPPGIEILRPHARPRLPRCRIGIEIRRAIQRSSTVEWVHSVGSLARRCRPKEDPHRSLTCYQLMAPRKLSIAEIAGVIDDYRQATRRAIEAGFDGVELHAASGYLPEQFLSSGSNQRQDQYGGSVENRTRFVLEVLAAMVEEAGADRVGIKISPEMNYNEENPAVLGSTTHLLQIFVNLPRDRQNAAPFALTLKPQDVPVVHRPGVRVRVPLGSFGGAHSPLTPPTEVTLLDVTLEGFAELEVPVPAGQRAFFMPIFGSAEVDGESFGLDDLGAPILPTASEATTHKLVGKGGGGQGRRVHRLAPAPASFLERAHGIGKRGQPDRGDRRLPPWRNGKALTAATHLGASGPSAPFTAKELHHES